MKCLISHLFALMERKILFEFSQFIPTFILPELDPRLSGLVWTAMLASLALVITIATPSSIITLIASIILRMIFSVGVEPTLWLLGVLNVSNPRYEKTWLWGLRQVETQTGLLS